MDIIGTIYLTAQDLTTLGEKRRTELYSWNEETHEQGEIVEVCEWEVTLDSIAWFWLYKGQDENASLHQQEMWRRRIETYGLFYGRTSIYEEGRETYLKVEEAIDEDNYGNPTYWEIKIDYN